MARNNVTFEVYPHPLSGTIHIPPSKSHSQRALLFAMKGQGVSHIDNLLNSTDCMAMLKAIQQFGAICSKQGNRIEIRGGFSQPTDVVDAANSGQILRFITALAALLPDSTTITGDHSIQTKRPIHPLFEALKQRGAKTDPISLTVQGPIRPGHCYLDGSDSQPISAMLMALSFLDGPSEIFVSQPKETPWIDLTLDWLRRLGALVTHKDYHHYRIEGNLAYDGFHYTVPGDYSSAAFPLAAALITQSPLTLTGLVREDIQGDRHLIDILKEMGAKIHWEDDRLLRVLPSQLRGITIDIDRCIDALPILAVVGCFAEGTTSITNGAIARKKESDRIAAITSELRKMGAAIEERADGLTISGSGLRGAHLSSHQDHRIALALAVAAMGASGSTQIEGAEWISKSYPTFSHDMNHIGAQIELDPVRL